MTKHHFSLWLLLAVAFAVFAAASAIGLPEIGGHQLKSSEIYSTLTAAREPGDELLPDSLFADTAAAPAPLFPVPCDTAAQTILFIGDSMLEGLGPRLAAYAEKNGHTLYNVIWYSSTSEVWGRSDKLRHYIEQIHPTYVFVCLGANELFVSDIKTKRRGYVRNIVDAIGDIPFVWIGPPNWKPDTGINELIEENTRTGQFFLSDGMSFQRSADGAHPTRSSAAQWMDSVARWMPAHALHPIRMDYPDRTTGRPRRVFVHQPNER